MADNISINVPDAVFGVWLKLPEGGEVYITMGEQGSVVIGKANEAAARGADGYVETALIINKDGCSVEYRNGDDSNTFSAKLVSLGRVQQGLLDFLDSLKTDYA